MIDTSELDEILEKLESLEDETLAVKLLAEFNEKSKKWGTLQLNLDPTLTDIEWKKRVDEAQKELQSVVEKIRDL